MSKQNRTFSSNLSIEVENENRKLSWESYLYIISFTFGFLLVGLYTAFVFVEYNKRIMKHRPVLVLVLYIEISILMEFISLITQPFEIYDHSQYIQRGYEPFLINAYCLLQIIFLKITRLDIKPIRFNGIKCVVGTTVILSLVPLGNDVLRHFANLHMDKIDFSGVVFVIYGLYLNLCFIVSAPQLGKYARETRIARKDISIQSISKRLDTASENSSVHTSLRIKTPRIRYSGNLVKLIQDPESSDSNTEIIRNNQKRFSDSDIKLYLGASKSQIENRRKSAESHRTFDKSEKYKTSADWSSDSNDEYYSVASLRESPLFSFRGKKIHSGYISKDDIRSQRKRSRCNSAELSNLSVNVDPLSYHTTNKRDSLGIARLSLSDAHSFLTSENSSSTSCRSDLGMQEGKRKCTGKHNKPKRVIDSGYIADCELISVTSEVNDHRRNSPSQPNESPFGMHLPFSSSFLSLYRLHQARILKNLMKITYALSMVVILLCIFKFYLIFVYATASSMVPEKHDVLWYTFRAVERILELLILISTTIAVHIVIRHRFHRKRRPSRSKNLDKTVV